jgi:hypothetical protein
MKNIIFLIFVIMFVSCNKSASSQSKKLQAHNNPTRLFCGQVSYGCEDVNTDTLEIDLANPEQVKIVRQYHGSDLPITSAFIGKLKKNNEIVATYSKELTAKSWRQVQDKFSQGEITLNLACDNLKTMKNCKVTGGPTGKDESLKNYPGWEKNYSEVKNFSCNSKQFKSIQASEKDCKSGE